MAKSDAEHLKSLPAREAWWISPDGDAYPCLWCWHERIAVELALAWYDIDVTEEEERFYVSSPGTVTLDEHGWLKVLASGNYSHGTEDAVMTDAQLEALVHILNETEPGSKRDVLKAQIDMDLHARAWQDGSESPPMIMVPDIRGKRRP